MTKQEIIIKLEEICREVFADDKVCVTENTCSADIEAWDSLEHIHLLMTVEKTFGMKFTMDEAVSMKTIGEMAEMILKKDF